MEKERSYESGFSVIGVTAAFSVFILVAVVGWQITTGVEAKNSMTSYVASSTGETASAASSNANETLPSSPGESALGAAILDGIVSRYTSLQDQGLYTEEMGKSVATKMAEDLMPTVEHRTYSSSDIKLDPDNSPKALLRYGDDLRASLVPLRKSTEPEFEIFAYYIDTKDTKYLVRLKEVAQYYRDAANATAKIVVPKDAVQEHIAILNAMEEFASTLDALVVNAADPYASTALLRTYNQAETDMYLSFKALAGYYKQKNS